MRVLHLIPAAWNYFSSVRDKAFELTEDEWALGIETEAITLQYGQVTENMAIEVRAKAPSRSFQGMQNLEDLISTFVDFDIIHVHCPTLGISRQLLKYKKLFPEKALVVTYHGRFEISDFFSVFVALYNFWYLPKIFKAADVIVSEVDGSAVNKYDKTITLTDLPHEVQLRPVVYYQEIYSKLV